MPLIKSHHDGNNIIVSCAAGFKLHSCSLGTHASILIKIFLRGFIAATIALSSVALFPAFILVSIKGLVFSSSDIQKYRLNKTCVVHGTQAFFADDVKFYIYEIYPVFLISIVGISAF